MTLKELRKSRGYKTQYELAEAMGISRVYMSNIEHQRYFPSPKMLKKMAMLLKCDVAKLYKIILYGNDKIKGE